MTSIETSATFQTAIVHLYRGEVARSDRWRTRLDTTTNWALTTSAAVVSFGIGNPGSPHITFILGIALVSVFLLLEARRYRYYDLWIRRVRLLEHGYFVPTLRQEPLDPDALRELASEISRPQIQLSLLSAITTRLNRAYAPMFLILIGAWGVKLYSHPARPESFHEFVYRARVGALSGWVALAVMGGFLLGVVLLFAASLYFNPPTGELQARPPSRRTALWERFARPYAVRNPRRRASAPAHHPGA